MKLSNDVLKEALALEQTIRDASRRLAEIKNAAREKGPFMTRQFVVSVVEQQRESLAGKDDFFAFYDRSELEEKGLLRVSTSQVVKITPKKVA